MVQLPYLQPFDDVNKRTSRLAANISLICENLSPLSFVDVPEREYRDGLLGVYELNRTDLLRDVFVWAYERSCARYSAVRQSMGEPDQFRLQYRDNITNLINEVISNCMDKKAAALFVKEYAANEINHKDQARFIEVAETELLNMHEGNMARYRIRPSQFTNWRSNWR
jgi:Fic family protein